jgi:hypothetical protein
MKTREDFPTKKDWNMWRMEELTRLSIEALKRAGEARLKLDRGEALTDEEKKILQLGK